MPTTSDRQQVAAIEPAWAALLATVRDLYGDGPVPLHAPQLAEADAEAVASAVRGGYVSSVGPQVAEFEQALAAFCGRRFCLSTVNGTSALHLALLVNAVQPGDWVITQAFTFVATANAIRYCGATPVLLDIDADTLGLSPHALEQWLQRHCLQQSGECIHRDSGRRVRACLPMHSFGHPARTMELREICDQWGLRMIEDAAEALGSRRQGHHVGGDGHCAVLSFNGNKVLTTGGGGALLTDDEALAERARHLGTTAKQPHPWAYEHDAVGFNYRMPNLNAALGLAQLERLPAFLASKQRIATAYRSRCAELTGVRFIDQPDHCVSNFWLNAVALDSPKQRDQWLHTCHQQQVFCRPPWTPLHRLPMYGDCPRDGLEQTDYWADRLINLPSSALPVPG